MKVKYKNYKLKLKNWRIKNNSSCCELKSSKDMLINTEIVDFLEISIGEAEDAKKKLHL